ncbi:hypothetical protein BY996DRAFT_6454344 [Phakopsora pachyrhizi]|nr:hypothetical protein BY996DRAFT_6454344 [Phakopsora pachyrhizi]
MSKDSNLTKAEFETILKDNQNQVSFSKIKLDLSINTSQAQKSSPPKNQSPQRVQDHSVHQTYSLETSLDLKYHENPNSKNYLINISKALNELKDLSNKALTELIIQSKGENKSLKTEQYDYDDVDDDEHNDDDQ